MTCKAIGETETNIKRKDRTQAPSHGSSQQLWKQPSREKKSETRLDNDGTVEEESGGGTSCRRRWLYSGPCALRGSRYVIRQLQIPQGGPFCRAETNGAVAPIEFGPRLVTPADV